MVEVLKAENETLRAKNEEFETTNSEIMYALIMAGLL
jgi:hypothetical protein